MEKSVRVIGLVSTGPFHNDKVKLPLPNDYLQVFGDAPRELMDDVKKNGWLDKKGNVCFSQSYQPAPAKGKDGNVYLVLNDAVMEERGPALMLEGMRILDE